MTFERIPDSELAKLSEGNGYPSVYENLAMGQTQEQATAYLVGRKPHYDDPEGRWLQEYIDTLAKLAEVKS